MRVVAIDVGFRNFAWCVVDSARGARAPLAWHHEDLWRNRKGVPSHYDLVAMCVWWYRRNTDLLDSCHYVVLENQMRKPFLIMNAAITAIMLDKTIVVHPITVGTFWQLPAKREPKKARGIEVIKENNVVFPETTAKLDDLADAWLMAVYMLVQKGAVAKTQLTIFPREQQIKRKT